MRGFAAAFTAACAVCLALYGVCSRYKPDRELGQGRHHRALTARSRGFQAAQLPTVLVQYIDILVVLAWLTPAMAGHQAVALAIALAPMAIVESVARVTHAHLGSIVEAEQRRQALRAHRRRIGWTVLVSVPLAILAAPWIIATAFGPAFTPELSAMAWVIAARCLLGANLALDLGMRATGRVRQAWASFPGACLALVIFTGLTSTPTLETI